MADTPKIETTVNYDKFVVLGGNREIRDRHVKKLMATIQKRNLLHLYPITVSDRMEVIDGQHRLEAAKRLNLPIYYIVDKTLTLSDTQLINTNMRNWQLLDFVNSYIDRGDEDYIGLKEFVDEYSLPISISASLLAGVTTMRTDGVINHLKNGHFKVRDMDGAKSFGDMILRMTPYVDTFVSKHGDFLEALRRVITKIPFEDLVNHLKKTGKIIYRRATPRDYLIQIEEILNEGVADSKKLRFY